MRTVEAAKILEFFRSLPPDAYITRVERASFRDQEIAATETMTVRHAIDETMANLSRPGRVALNFGRYWRDPVPPSGIAWRIEEVAAGPLPRSISIDVEWRPATPDEEARARAHHTGRWRSWEAPGIPT